jgi:hypothetical protein
MRPLNAKAVRFISLLDLPKAQSIHFSLSGKKRVGQRASIAARNPAVPPMSNRWFPFSIVRQF